MPLAHEMNAKADVTLKQPNECKIRMAKICEL